MSDWRSWLERVLGTSGYQTAQDLPEQADARIADDSTAESRNVAVSRLRSRRASLQTLSPARKGLATQNFQPDRLPAASEMRDHATDEPRHAAPSDTLVNSETGARFPPVDRSSEVNISRDTSPEISSRTGPLPLRRNRRQRLRETHHDLLTMRLDLRLLRLRAYEQRTALRRKRQHLDEEFDKIVESMSNLTTTSDISGIVALHPKIEAVQLRRKELRAEQSDYDIQEDELNREDFTFEKKEEQVYKHESTSQFSVLVDDSFEGSLGGASDTYSHSPAEGSIAVAMGYSSRRGAVKKVKSQLKSLRRERAQLLEEQAIRDEIGRDLDDGPKAFLIDFSENEKALLQQLAKIEDDLFKSVQGPSEFDLSTASLPLMDEEGDGLDRRESMDWPPRSAASVTFLGDRDQTNDAPIDSFVSRSRNHGDAMVEDEQAPQQKATGAAGYIDGWILQVPPVQESITPPGQQSPLRIQDASRLRAPDTISTYNARVSIGAVSHSSGETGDSPRASTPNQAPKRTGDLSRTDTPRPEKAQPFVTEPIQVPASYDGISERDSDVEQIRQLTSNSTATDEPSPTPAEPDVPGTSSEALPWLPEPFASRGPTAPPHPHN